MTLKYIKKNVLFGYEFPEWFDPNVRDDYRSKEYFYQRTEPTKEYTTKIYNDIHSFDVNDGKIKLSDIPEWILNEYKLSDLDIWVSGGDDCYYADLYVEVPGTKKNFQYEQQLIRYNEYKEVEEMAHSLYEKYLELEKEDKKKKEYKLFLSLKEKYLNKDQ